MAKIGSNNWKRKLSVAHRGKKHSEETKRKISISMSKFRKGKKHSKSTINKLRLANEGANNPMYGKHYFGKDSPHWKGGRKKDKEGYILIYTFSHPYRIKGNYVFEHRLIIEKQLGRYLLPNEVIHHLGKKNDNRTQMLMAFINTSAHHRFHSNPNKVKSSEIIFDGRRITPSTSK